MVILQFRSQNLSMLIYRFMHLCIYNTCLVLIQDLTRFALGCRLPLWVIVRRIDQIFKLLSQRADTAIYHVYLWH